MVTRCEVDGGSLFPEIKWAKVKRVENSKDIFLLIRYLLWIHRYIYTIYTIYTTYNIFLLFSGFENKNSLIIQNVSKADEGVYACLVTNQAGQNLATAELSVLADYEAIQVTNDNVIIATILQSC